MSALFLFLTCTLVMILGILVASQAQGIPINKKSKKSKLNKISQRQIWLGQARVNMSVSQFWLVTFLCGLITFLVVSLFSRTPLVAFVIAIGSASIPYMFIAKKRSDISRELINDWPDALRDISATVSSGHSLSFALHSLAQIGPASISSHMARFCVLERSMGFVPALEIVRDEMNDATTDRIIEVLIVAHERGGKVVREIIDDLIEATSQDIALADTIATESIEMKINSRAVVVIPWVVLVLLTLSGGIFRDFYQSSSGAVIIAIGAIMSALGILILSRLTRTELEARVFVSSKKVNA